MRIRLWPEVFADQEYIVRLLGLEGGHEVKKEDMK